MYIAAKGSLKFEYVKSVYTKSTNLLIILMVRSMFITLAKYSVALAKWHRISFNIAFINP